MAANSKQKGSVFEREICKALSLWWTDGEREDIFWRTASSGGRATQRFKKGKTTAGAEGDITALDPIGRLLLRALTVEIKRGYPKLDALSVIDRRANSRPSIMEDFWEQANNSREQSGARFPVVIFRRDQKVTCILFDRRMVNEMANYLGPDRSSKITMRIGADNVVIMRFEDFLNYVDPAGIASLVKED